MTRPFVTYPCRIRPSVIALSALLVSFAAPVEAQTLYREESRDRLPVQALEGYSMDGVFADFDSDGDLDLLIASEYRPNIYLMNDGRGRFENASHRIPQVRHDSEDIAVADFDGDGDLDAVIVSEDDKTNEYYRNTGDGRFEDAGALLPVEGITNGVATGDVDGDGDMDLVLANNGQNFLVLNDGAGTFVDATRERLPEGTEVSQDVSLGDVDGDGDLDMLFGNEGPNVLMVNDGQGTFTVTQGALPNAAQESREADLGDADGDGDLDILEGNVRFNLQDADPLNRLLINDGKGQFTDGGDRLPEDPAASAEADFLDLDADGDLDIVTTDILAVRAPGRGRLKVFLNDGTGHFEEATDTVFPPNAVGNTFDIAQGDVDGDGLPDLYVANRIGPDLLLIQTRREER